MRTPLTLLALVSMIATACELVELPETGALYAPVVEVSAPQSPPPAPQMRSQIPAPVTPSELGAVAAGLNRFGLALLEAQRQLDGVGRNLAFSPLALQSDLAQLQRSTTGLTACELGTQARLGLAEERVTDGFERLADDQRLARGTVSASGTLQTRATIAPTPWHTAFAAQASRPAFFHQPDAKREVMMMHATRQLPYLANDNFQLLALPLQSEGRARSLIFLLPRSDDGLENVEELLEGRRLCRWIADAKEENVAVSLPRFTLTSARSIGPALRQLGIRRIFSQSEEMPALGRALSDVHHAVQFSLDEQGIGTEQAHANATPSAEPDPVADAQIFRADHPFLMLIRDDESGALLLIARVVSP